MTTTGRPHRFKRGIALPIALSIIVVLITLAMALIVQSLSTQGVREKHEKQAAQEDVADIVKGRMMEILADPSAANLADLGLNKPPVAPDIAPFTGKVGDYTFSGSFNGGDAPWSTYNPIPDGIDPKSDGYPDNQQVPFYDSKNYQIPPQHTLLFVKVQKENEPARQFYSMLSVLFPYAAIATQGNIELMQVTSARDPYGAENKGGLKPYVAGQIIAINSTLEGVAQSFLPAGQKPISLNSTSRGIAETGYSLPQSTSGEVTKLNNSVKEAMKVIIGEAKDEGFANFAAMLLPSMLTYMGKDIVANEGASFDVDKNMFVWPDSIIVPENTALLFPYNLEIEGSLVLMDNALFYTKGDLLVKEHLIIGKKSAITTDGNMHIVQSVDFVWVKKDKNEKYGGIEAALIASKNLSLDGGLRHLNQKPMLGLSENPLSMLPNPIPKPLEDIAGSLWEEFQKRIAEVLGQITDAWNKIAQYFAKSVTITPGSDDYDIPPLLIASKGGSVSITDATRLNGLIVSQTGINLNALGSKPLTFTGLLITGGNISARSTTLRYYPYFSHGRIPPEGKDSTFFQLTQPHIVSSGEFNK